MKVRKIILFPLGVVYHLITEIRNKLYDKQVLKTVEFSLPVISVGNLAIGGTGKTPHIEYLIRTLKPNYKIAVLSRGYGRKTKRYIEATQQSTAQEIGDEPTQYKRKFPEIKVVVENKRVLGVEKILASDTSVEVILLDDAFQHRAIKAGLSIVITDYNRPLHNDYLLPAGNLRENKQNINRADIVIVSKCPKQLSLTERERIKKQLKFKNPDNIYFTTVKYGNIVNIRNAKNKIETIKDYAVVLVTGIARPQALQNKIKGACKELLCLEYKDHHNFTHRDIEKIKRSYNLLNHKKKIILTTEKDASRLLYQEELANYPVYSIGIEIAFLKREQEFIKQIEQYVRTNKRNS